MLIALAEAELEYPENHISRSIYVGFPVTTLSPALVSKLGAGTESSLKLAIWTTTPCQLSFLKIIFNIFEKFSLILLCI